MNGSLTNDCVGDTIRRTVFDRSIAVVDGLLRNKTVTRTSSGAAHILCQRNTALCNIDGAWGNVRCWNPDLGAPFINSIGQGKRCWCVILVDSNAW